VARIAHVTFGAPAVRASMQANEIARVVATLERAIHDARLAAQRSARIEDVLAVVRKVRMTHEVIVHAVRRNASMETRWIRDLLQTIENILDELDAKVARARGRLH